MSDGGAGCDLQRALHRRFHHVGTHIGGPGLGRVCKNMQLMLQACDVAGAPVEESKSEGPTSSLTFLRIEIDSVALVLRLPANKLTQLQSFLKQWRGKKACTKRDLLSIIGSLSHACKVVRPGQIFLSHLLINLAKLAKHHHHHLCLSHEACSDLEW